jgi:short-subunit dehydrogenase
VKGNVLVAGAGSTLARALAEGLARRGHGLVLAARDEAEAARTAADLALRFGVPAVALAFDARDAAATAGLVPRAEEALPGGLAGVVVAFAAMPDQEEVERDPAAGLAMIDVNVRSTSALLEAAAAHLETRPGSFLCAFSSVAGDRGRRKNYAYGATKAALSATMEGLSARLAPRGVRVLCVKPGPADSAMTWGLVPAGSPLLASPGAVARDVLAALDRGRSVVYTPRIWRPVMAVLRALPAAIFRRLPI